MKNIDLYFQIYISKENGNESVMSKKYKMIKSPKA